MEVVMKFLRLLILISIATGLLAFPISDVNACSCREDPIPPCEEYWRAEAVFAGKAIKQSTFYVEEGEGNSKYRFQQVLVRFSVEQAFKGISGEEVDIETGMGGGDCGYHFKDGERYVVYAFRSGRDKSHLYTGICNRIKLAAEAEEDFAYFRAIPEPGTGGVVFGRVRKWTMPLSDYSRTQETYLDNIKIMIEGNGRRFETTTNKEGNYQVSGLAPGQYKVKADISESLSLYSQLTVDVVDRGCVARDFYVQANGQISGRVFDEKGNPLPNIKVDIISAEGARDVSSTGKWRFTDSEGRYKIDWIPPGAYHLGVGLVGANGNLCPYPRLYMPDFRDAKDARVVNLKEGQKVEDQNISLPSLAPDLEFEVEVVWPDGSPARTAVVILHGDGPSVQITGQREQSERPGIFRVSAFKTCKYWVTAFTYGHPGEPGGGKPWHAEIKIDSSANFTKPIRLTLSQPGFLCEHRRPK